MAHLAFGAFCLAIQPDVVAKHLPYKNKNIPFYCHICPGVNFFSCWGAAAVSDRAAAFVSGIHSAGNLIKKSSNPNNHLTKKMRLCPRKKEDE